MTSRGPFRPKTFYDSMILLHILGMESTDLFLLQPRLLGCHRTAWFCQRSWVKLYETQIALTFWGHGVGVSITVRKGSATKLQSGKGLSTSHSSPLCLHHLPLALASSELTEHPAFPTMSLHVCPGLAGAAVLLTPAVVQHGLMLVERAVAEAGHPHGAMHHPYCTASPHTQKGECLQLAALIFQPGHLGSIE